MGVATIQAQSTLQLRVDPESIIFGYVLNTKTDSTYGGKVIQILSTTITDLEVKAVAGAGRRDYLIQVATFFKDMMTWQRDSQQPGTFSYPPRNYTLHVYAAALQFSEATENVAFPYTMKFKVLDDAGQVSGEVVQAEIDRLKDGVGYTKNEYNDPSANAKPVVPAYDPNGGEQPGGGAGGAGGGAGGLPGPGAP
jgi:hypothetical protein